MKNAKYILRLTLTLLLVTTLVAAALAGVNALTKDRIAQIQQEKTVNAMKAVLPAYESFVPCSFTDTTGLVASVYVPEGADTDAYVAQVTPNGFGGQIVLMVGVENGIVTGISVVSHSETAGLGAVIADKNTKGEDFRQQFTGESGQLAVDKDGGTIDAIAGATISSRAVTQGVNAALAVTVGE